MTIKTFYHFPTLIAYIAIIVLLILFISFSYSRAESINNPSIYYSNIITSEGDFINSQVKASREIKTDALRSKLKLKNVCESIKESRAYNELFHEYCLNLLELGVLLKFDFKIMKSSYNDFNRTYAHTRKYNRFEYDSAILKEKYSKYISDKTIYVEKLKHYKNTINLNNEKASALTNKIREKSKEIPIEKDLISVPYSKKKSKSIKNGNNPSNNNDVLKSGSGVMIDKNHAITNHHVIKDCIQIRVRINGVYSEGKITASSPDVDIAIIETKNISNSYATFRDQQTTKLGESIVVAGFPLRGQLSDELIVTNGIVSALSGFRGDEKLLQISAPVQSGNSGGPLLDKSGSVIGMIVSKLSTSINSLIQGNIHQNVNFAIKGSLIKLFLDSNEIKYNVSDNRNKFDTIEIASRANEFTVPIECY